MSAKSLLQWLCVPLLLILTAYNVSAQLAPQFSGTPRSGCTPLLVNFQDATTGGATQWRWDLGNGTISFLQNPSVTYFRPGTYAVKLVVTNAAGNRDSIIKAQYITIYALPVVAFTATPTRGCYPLPVQFTDNSSAGSGTINSWFWDFGDGITSTQQNPNHVYNSSGNYNVSLIITNSNGCTKTLTKPNYIATGAGLNALFTNSTPTGCIVPETISFQNLSSGSGTLGYLWNFGDGNTSTASQPTHTYTSPGNYVARLIVTNNTGCVDTFFHPTSINIGVLRASFSAPNTICAGTAFSLTTTTVPTPVAVRWNFGDGTSSTDINPVKLYNNSGTYNIKLIVGTGNCADSTTKTITVKPRSVTAFTGSPLTGCSLPHTVNFTNSSTSAISYNWSFGDGSSSTDVSPAHTYTSAGNYTVTLITTNANGCTDTLRKTDYVKIQRPQVVINNLPQRGCSPLTWTFDATITSTEPVTEYLWNFGDGSTSTQVNPTHVFPTGSYDIELIITTASGCKDTVRVVSGIVASPKPRSNFSATPRDACAKSTIQFTDESVGDVTEWLWFFGDGSSGTDQNPGHVYSDTGYFTITLIVSNNGCKDTLIRTNYIHIKPPIAAFSVPLNCNNKYTRNFVDGSIGADEWRWDFGDGGTSTIPSPTHTYATAGRYNVTLTVFNRSTGCDYSKIQQVIIADERALFSANTNVCRNVANVFTATSPNVNAEIINYSWDFGDGNTASGNPISHTYTSAGVYTVRLVITDANGCTDTTLKNRYINVFGPIANFVSSVPGACLQSSITFTDLSVPDSSHPINQWRWAYGDGIVETLTAPPFIHNYLNLGVFNVQLRITDTYGCTDSITKQNLITISVPKAAFATADTNSCPGKPINFINASTGPSLSYQWTFGDGATSTLANPIHSYSSDGVYSVSLTITDQFGCVSTLNRLQYIKITTPFANFTVNDSIGNCPPLIVNFTNTAVNYASFIWDFGDGNTSLSVNPSHLYNTAGVYIAKLTVTSRGGCVSVKTKEIKVGGPLGTFTYTPLTGCNPLTVTFTANSFNRTSFVWDFNDGATVSTTDSIVSHTYTELGNYVPKMILKDIAGCVVPIRGLDTIRVKGVNTSFTVDTTLRCNSGTVVFTNTSVTNDGIAGYLWDFGDGTTSTDISPAHFYATQGNYRPRLTATTTSGCVGRDAGTVNIKVVKTPEISAAQPLNGCVPLTVNLRGTLLNADTAAINWVWRMSSGQTFIGQQYNPPAIKKGGNYTVTLIAINSSGCRDTASVGFEAYALPPINAGQDIYVCEGTSQTITATGGSSYLWSPATGLSCTTCASPIAKPSSPIMYTVTGKSSQGCVNKDSIMVDVVYPFEMQQGYPDTLCVGGSAILTISGASTYSWSPATGLNSTTASSVKAAPAITTEYTVIGKDGKNCFSDTAYFPVKVYPIPKVSVKADTAINVGSIVTLTPTLSADVTKVMWSPSIAILSSNYPSVTVKPTSNVQYRVRVSNPGGCMAEASLNVVVLCNGANVFIPNTFSPNGDGANEIFYPRGTGLFGIKQAKIFNRWGEEVFAKINFSANDPSAGWNGTYKGQRLAPDVYVYMFEILCENNTVMLYKGNITLLK